HRRGPRAGRRGRARREPARRRVRGRARARRRYARAAIPVLARLHGVRAAPRRGDPRSEARDSVALNSRRRAHLPYPRAASMGPLPYPHRATFLASTLIVPPELELATPYLARLLSLIVFDHLLRHRIVTLGDH